MMAKVSNYCVYDEKFPVVSAILDLSFGEFFSEKPERFPILVDDLL